MLKAIERQPTAQEVCADKLAAAQAQRQRDEEQEAYRKQRISEELGRFARGERGAVNPVRLMLQIDCELEIINERRDEAQRRRRDWFDGSVAHRSISESASALEADALSIQYHAN